MAKKLRWALGFKHPYWKIVKALPNNCWTQLRGQHMWGAIPYITFLHGLCLRGFLWEKLQADTQSKLWLHCKRINVIPFVSLIYFSWCSRLLNVVRCNTDCLSSVSKGFYPVTCHYRIRIFLNSSVEVTRAFTRFHGL